MATFKVGQRVRSLPTSINVWEDEGTIVDHREYRGQDDWLVLCDKHRGATGGYWHLSCELAPLTDPKADEFIERMKKLKPYDEPVAPKPRGNRLVTLDEILRKL